jgi:rhodanese-related sulfurtransferase
MLVDVRSPREFQSGHIPGAVNVPLGELKSRQAELEAGRGGLYVVCQSGGRSAKATKQ